MKQCSKCKEVKQYADFHKNKQCADGYRPTCKACRNPNKPQSEERKAYLRDYAKKNKTRFQKNRAKWEAKQYGFDIDVSLMPDGAWEAMMVFYGGKCAKCGATSPLELDHIVATSQGGEHTLLNTQVLCKTHNASKQDKTIDYRGFPRLVDCVGY